MAVLSEAFLFYIVAHANTSCLSGLSDVTLSEAFSGSSVCCWTSGTFSGSFFTSVSVPTSVVITPGHTDRHRTRTLNERHTNIVLQMRLKRAVATHVKIKALKRSFIFWKELFTSPSPPSNPTMCKHTALSPARCAAWEHLSVSHDTNHEHALMWASSRSGSEVQQTVDLCCWIQSEHKASVRQRVLLRHTNSQPGELDTGSSTHPSWATLTNQRFFHWPH